MQFRVFIFTILATQFACKQNEQQAAETSCPLGPGDYPVQTVTYHADQGQYELMILNAPACFHQPLTTKNLQLARFEDSEKSEKVKLKYNGEQDATLYMAEDFQIKMVQTVTENGVKKEQTGSWSPFVSGLAGAAVGALAGSMLTRALTKPQYYTPPPMEAGRTDLRGYGGVGDTRDGAARSYQQKFANRANGPVAPAIEKRSFFKTKTQNTNPQPTGAVRTYQPAPAKKGFFKSRRR